MRKVERNDSALVENALRAVKGLDQETAISVITEERNPYRENPTSWQEEALKKIAQAFSDTTSKTRQG